MEYLRDESCLYNYAKAEEAGAFLPLLLHGGRVQKRTSS